MPDRAFGSCEPDCECYGCTLRSKSISTRLDTGVSGMANVKQVSAGQDGVKGRNSESGELY